jgi:hypothetical protein
LDLVVGDHVVVFAREKLTVARVVTVHDTLEIVPNAPYKYGWTVAKVDMAHWLANEEKNKQVESLLQEAYVNSMRQ